MPSTLPRLPALAVLALALAAGLPAASQTTDHSGHSMTHGNDTATESAATLAYRAANAAMHAAMDVPYTGDADVDFIANMLPHHQGAVDMARIVLEHGSDPEVRKLAEAVIAAQQAEIAFMQDWLARNGG